MCHIAHGQRAQGNQMWKLFDPQHSIGSRVQWSHFQGRADTEGVKDNGLRNTQGDNRNDVKRPGENCIIWCVCSTNDGTRNAYNIFSCKMPKEETTNDTWEDNIKIYLGRTVQFKDIAALESSWVQIVSWHPSFFCVYIVRCRQRSYGGQ
jgi:hypothetical protein